MPLSEIFSTLQIYLGSLYVNDFNRFGRTYQVTAQADAQFRLRPDDIRSLKTRNAQGNMVPLGTLVDVRDDVGPDKVVRYNLYSAAEMNGNPRPGISTGQAIAAMEQLADKSLPASFAYEWTELTLQQKLAGNTAIFVFPLCVLLVFLTLAAQYESWSLPLAIILIVPMCLLSRDFRRLAARHGQQHLHPDRLRRAGGSGLQERHPHRGVRQAAPGRTA